MSTEGQKEGFTEGQQKEKIDVDVEKEKLRLEKLRLRLNFWKFVLGTVAIGILTAVINWQIQIKQINIDQQQTERELQLKQLESDREFLGRFVETALDENLEARLRFAHYFASLTVSQEQKSLWNSYYEDLKVEATAITIKLATAQSIQEQIQEELNKETDPVTKEDLEGTRQIIEQEIQELKSEVERQVTPTPTLLPPIPTFTVALTATPIPSATPLPVLKVDDFELAEVTDYLVNEYAKRQGNEGEVRITDNPIPQENPGNEALAFDFNISTNIPDYIGFGKTLSSPQDWSSYSELCLWVDSDIGERNLKIDVQIGEHKDAVFRHDLLPAETKEHCIYLRESPFWDRPLTDDILKNIGYFAIFVSGQPDQGEGVIYVDNIYVR